MKNNRTLRPALSSLLAATALLSTAAVAQDATTAAPVQTVTPPPVVSTVPAKPATAPTATKGIGDPSSTTPIAPEALAQAQEIQAAKKAAPKPAAKPATHIAARSTTTRTITTRAAPAPAPVAATPAPVAVAPQPAAPAPAPVAETPPVTTPAPQPAPVAAAPDTTQTDAATTTTAQNAPIWPWALGGLVVLAGIIGLFLFGRRRAAPRYEEAYVEPAYVAPPLAEQIPVAVAPVAEPEARRFVPAAAPVMQDNDATIIEEAVAAPAVPEESSVEHAATEDVASLTAAEAPIADRPWLELAMRPVRAGTNIDEALVEIELTIGNSGNIPAEDVHVSTFMLSADPGSAAEMERLLLAHRGDAGVPMESIAPGEGKRLDATLALLKSEFVGEDIDTSSASFQPVIVADARYRLPDGTEGHTSASFLIGVTPEEGEGIDAFPLARPEMFDNVEARLASEPQHA